MSNNEKKDKGFAIGGTILFHALAILILLLMAFRTPLPLPGEEGVEVNLGMMDQGVGDQQPEKSTVPQTYTPPQKSNKSEEDLITQNNSETPSIEKPKVNKPKQDKPTEQPKPTVDDRAMYHGSNNPQAGGSEGVTGQPGDQGKPNGDLSSMNYSGSGGNPGNGRGYDLGGRGAKSLHRPKDDFSEEGIVVVDIWVNRQGNVTRAEISIKGTTTISPTLRSKAKQSALQSTFASDPNAPEEQHGTITYTFVTK